MKIRVPFRSLAAVAGLMLLGAASPSWADACRADAKQTYRDCGATCKEDFQSDKDACLDRDHDCVEACRGERYDCRQATGFDGAIAACNATLATAKAQCRNDHAPGTPGRDTCIDQAQVVAFQCRDSAREAAKQPLKQCRKNFVVCAKACPPASPVAPANPQQCKQDAKTAYKTCSAECKEDFQLAKDVCRNRDHTCVEQARADRETCRQPFEDQLASDVAACNLTLHGDGTAENPGAINTCKSLYGDGTPDLDQCIDNAQVAAFECRDQAHEDAHPGFEGCRQDFRTHVEACGPA
jgi:hypothetical protein